MLQTETYYDLPISWCGATPICLEWRQTLPSACFNNHSTFKASHKRSRLWRLNFAKVQPSTAWNLVTLPCGGTKGPSRGELKDSPSFLKNCLKCSGFLDETEFYLLQTLGWHNESTKTVVHPGLAQDLLKRFWAEKGEKGKREKGKKGTKILFLVCLLWEKEKVIKLVALCHIIWLVGQSSFSTFLLTMLASFYHIIPVMSPFISPIQPLEYF